MVDSGLEEEVWIRIQSVNQEASGDGCKEETWLSGCGRKEGEDEKALATPNGSRRPKGSPLSTKIATGQSDYPVQSPFVRSIKTSATLAPALLVPFSLVKLLSQLFSKRGERDRRNRGKF